MKKFVALLGALVIALSLAACNGAPESSAPSETPAVSTEVSTSEPDIAGPDEPARSEYEQWKRSMLEHIDEALPPPLICWRWSRRIAGTISTSLWKLAAPGYGPWWFAKSTNLS